MVRAYSHDTANGYLTIQNGSVQFINCHLIPQRHTKENVLEYILTLNDKCQTTFVIGDFNENHKTVKEKIECVYTCPYYGKTYKKKAIDQIVFNVGVNLKYTTGCTPKENISDHNAITLTFHPLDEIDL